MTVFLSNLFNYLKDETSLSISDEYIDKYEPRIFVVIIMNIFAWLRLEYKRYSWNRKCKPLELDMTCQWCIALNELITSDEQFSKYFVIVDNKFGFRDAITDKEKMEAREWVFRNYTPNHIT